MRPSTRQIGLTRGLRSPRAQRTQPPRMCLQTSGVYGRQLGKRPSGYPPSRELEGLRRQVGPVPQVLLPHQHNRTPEWHFGPGRRPPGATKARVHTGADGKSGRARGCTRAWSHTSSVMGRFCCESLSAQETKAAPQMPNKHARSERPLCVIRLPCSVIDQCVQLSVLHRRQQFAFTLR